MGTSVVMEIYLEIRKHGYREEGSRKRLMEQKSTSHCMKNKQIMKHTGNLGNTDSEVFSRHMVEVSKFHTRDWQTGIFVNI